MAIDRRHGLRPLLLEVFVASNFAFLTLDIYLAHSVNRFRHPAEWIPFWFSVVAAVERARAFSLLSDPRLRTRRSPNHENRFQRSASWSLRWLLSREKRVALPDPAWPT